MLLKKNKSVAKNAIYQTFYSVLATITPLITIPIVSREVGALNLGIFSYTLTVSHYFTVFAMLGIVNYGTRSIAEVIESKESLTKTFWSIYAIQFIMAVFCNIAYFIYLFIFEYNNSNIHIFLLQSFWILGTLFDINWFFFGLEDFQVIVKRNILIKLGTIVSIFLFVNRDNNPLQTYTLIMAGGSLLSNIIILPLLKDKLFWYYPKFSEIKIHFIPVLILFLPIIAGMFFGSVDKIMLGNMSEYDELGYYYNADRVIYIPIGIINGLSSVLFPHISSLVANNKRKECFIFISKSYDIVIWLGILLSFGIAGCAKEFVPLFFGSGFERCVDLIYVLVPVLIINVICIFYRMQYLVPFHYDKLYSKALIIGTIINIFLNFLLIPSYKAIGAAVATLIAQVGLMIVQFKEHKGIELSKWFIIFIKYIVIGFIMLVCMRCVSTLSCNNMINLLIEIIIGGIIYLLLSLCYWKVTNQLDDRIAMLKR